MGALSPLSRRLPSFPAERPGLLFGEVWNSQLCHKSSSHKEVGTLLAWQKVVYIWLHIQLCKLRNHLSYSWIQTPVSKNWSFDLGVLTRSFLNSFCLSISSAWGASSFCVKLKIVARSWNKRKIIHEKRRMRMFLINFSSSTKFKNFSYLSLTFG